MARRKIGLEDLDRMGIDPETGRLFWDNQEVITTLALPWAVNAAIIAAAVIAGLSLAWSVIRYFLDRSERRRNHAARI
jgi:hypothetical protein